MTFEPRIEDVASVYIGRANRCCCGCSGNHIYQESTREFAGKRRGYAVADSEINQKELERVFNLVFGDRYRDKSFQNREGDNSIWVRETKTVQYIVYFTSEGK